MSEQNPKHLQDLDPAQFVGEAPAGDASPGDFLSTDQSASDHSDTEDDQPDPQEEA